MKNLLVIILLSMSLAGLKGQSTSFIDSLKEIPENQIFTFEDNCIGCLVSNRPCPGYGDSGDPKDKYVLWRNVRGFHIKKFNVCGSSKVLTFRKWKNNPFDLIQNKSKELDTVEIRYPLSFDRRDSSWSVTSINHYEYFLFSFITYDIRDAEIRAYAFRESMDNDERNIFLRKNKARYQFNNTTNANQELKQV